MVRFYPFSANDHILCVKLCQNSVQILKILSSGNSLSYTKYYNPVLINSIIIGLLGSLSILHISSNHFIWVVNNPVKKRAKFWQRSSNRTKFCLKFSPSMVAIKHYYRSGGSRNVSERRVFVEQTWKMDYRRLTKNWKFCWKFMRRQNLLFLIFVF